MSEIDEVIDAWKPYVHTLENGRWQGLIESVQPKPSGCGPIYEMPNPINGRPNEDFCIADMQGLDKTEPHYHPEGVTEIYFVLQGLGKIVVGDEQRDVSAGDVVVMPSLTAHFTIPVKELVLAVVNTPPFKPEDYIPVHETNPTVQFDKDLYDSLVAQS